MCPSLLDCDGAVRPTATASSQSVSAIDGAVVAFEADEVDAATSSGRSVVVTGEATLLTDLAERARFLRAGPRSRAPTPHEVFLRIGPELIAGRGLVGGRSLRGVPLPP
ncbi:pyridoxamine 5'-phosphate oxidase family protein [Streptomyces sp. NPDC048696]|uniref:pyridoxamine 5'-phosphate oxidase family protein n=1 Tax=Streptomyces sp. NPDC048696 TaxID=3365585 RepID=UPI003721CF97